MNSNSRSEAVGGASLDSELLSNRRILIVEDDPFISMEMEEILSAAGAQTIERAPSVEVALETLGKNRPDAALLDLNLRGVRSTSVARALISSRIPFVLTSGYSRSQIDEPLLNDVPLVPKPVLPSTLLAALKDLLAH
ncbi:response regulator [Qipengyuania sp. SM2507]